MSIFDGVGKKLGSVVNTVSDKSSKLIETQKINFEINDQTKKLEKLYADLGRSIYQSAITNPGQGNELITQISESLSKLEELKKKVEDIKSTEEK